MPRSTCMTPWNRVKARALRHRASVSSRLFKYFHPKSLSINTPHALSHFPDTAAHLPHRLEYDQRSLPLESRIRSRTHHLQHASTRHNLPIYAKHSVLGCAVWIIKQQHGRQDELPGAEDRGRVAGTAISRAVPHPAQEGHRTARLWHLQQALPRSRRLHVHRLRHASLQSQPQVRLRLRLARLLGRRSWCSRPATRPWPGHDEDGDCMQ